MVKNHYCNWVQRKKKNDQAFRPSSCISDSFISSSVGVFLSSPCSGRLCHKAWVVTNTVSVAACWGAHSPSVEQGWASCSLPGVALMARWVWTSWGDTVASLQASVCIGTNSPALKGPHPTCLMEVRSAVAKPAALSCLPHCKEPGFYPGPPKSLFVQDGLARARKSFSIWMSEARRCFPRDAVCRKSDSFFQAACQTSHIS